MRIIALSFFTVLLFSAFLFSQNLIYNSDLEIAEPWLFYKVGEGDGGAVLTWATDEAHNFHRSFKVSKSATSTAPVGWHSRDYSQLWWNHVEALLYKVGGWYKTSGVNTSPASDAERIAFVYQFYKDGSPLVSDVMIPVDQTVATTDWDTVFSFVSVPDTADSAACFLMMGENATGTVWFDDLVLSSDPWSGGVFNASAEMPDGYGGGYSAGAAQSDFEYASDDAHSGTYSAKLVERDTESDEITWSTVPNAGITAGNYYKISVWVKTDSANTDPAYIPSAIWGQNLQPRINLCYSFMRAGWETDWTWMSDQFMYINQVDSSTGWTEYMAIAQAPDEAVGITMRPRFNATAMGYAWFDDLSVEELTIVTSVKDKPVVINPVIPSRYTLEQNYPNPFNPMTTIQYGVPNPSDVRLIIYDILGRKVRTLVNEHHSAGTYQITWNGLNDYGMRVSSGVYFYRLETGKEAITKKLLLMK
jgi:hypothetical protein